MRELNVQEVDQVSGGGFFESIVDWWNDLTTFDVGGASVQVQPDVKLDGSYYGVKIDAEW